MAYWTVLVVELIGDKAICTVVSLSTQYRPASVYAGISAAFMVKMFVAVSLARVLAALPGVLTSLISAFALFTTAFLLWRTDAEPPPHTGARLPAANGVTAAFAAVLLSEWADAGQMSAAALVAEYRTPVAIWIGSTAALMTKGTLALMLGAELRRRVPTTVARVAAVASCTILGIVALFGAWPR